MKTLSVLMPNYNHGRFVGTAIEAVLRQSRAPVEIIVADDASTDNSLDVIEKLAEAYGVIRVIRNRTRQGAVENVNLMLEMAGGDYVFGAAADDQVLPGLFEASLGMLERHPQAGLCSSLSRKMAEDGTDLGLFASAIVAVKPTYLPPRRAAGYMARGRQWVMGNTAIYNRKYLVDEGGFDPRLKSYADGFMQMVLAMKYGACFIPRPLANWRILENSFSATTRDDIDLWGEVIANTEASARDRYADLLPEAFLKEWKTSHLVQKKLWALRHASSDTAPAVGKLRLFSIARKTAESAAIAIRLMGLRRTVMKAAGKLIDLGYVAYLERTAFGRPADGGAVEPKAARRERPRQRLARPEPAPADRQGDDMMRFAFGRNWRAFLASMSEARIQEAKSSLRTALGRRHLNGLRFLDAGSGSGLFSLAARQMGATVHSFDYDPDSVACTEALRRRYCENDLLWQVAQGSVLDRTFVSSMGKFDVVYSWGVLHHTGDMWKAFEVIQAPVRPGGQLFIAIYNDQGLRSRLWRRVKQLYLHRWWGKGLVLGVFIPLFVARALVAGTLKHRHPLRQFTDYKRNRGMSIWHDWIDWLGGYPFEVASPEAVIAAFHRNGFTLTFLKRTRGWGCNEFVFQKAGGAMQEH